MKTVGSVFCELFRLKVKFNSNLRDRQGAILNLNTFLVPTKMIENCPTERQC